MSQYNFETNEQTQAVKAANSLWEKIAKEERGSQLACSERPIFSSTIHDAANWEFSNFKADDAAARARNLRLWAEGVVMDMYIDINKSDPNRVAVLVQVLLPEIVRLTRIEPHLPVQDIESEVLMSLKKRIRGPFRNGQHAFTYEGAAKFRTYIKTTVTNKVRDAIRRNTRDRNREAHLVNGPTIDPCDELACSQDIYEDDIYARTGKVRDTLHPSRITSLEWK